VNWRFEEPDQRLVLELSSDVKPRRAYAWVAYAPSRDFRKANWSAQRLRRNSNTYRFEIERPPEGYAAVFGEAVFGKRRKAYYLSSNVRIVDYDGSTAAGGAP
jgi:PhoPQ-activated pathogenicity-related protein